ncbi:MAG: regulatory signaling modulator protein AmpE [Oleiphilaceae bacterium]|nr:regulatory signaling modulator protein AmpE [Oleiphilaceae bacterium]
MRLLVILLALVLRRQMDARGRLDPDQWQRRFMARMPGDERGAGTVYRVLFLYLALVLATALVTWGLGGMAGGLWASLLALLLMLLASGMPGWREPLTAYSEAWERGDMQAAWHHVSHLLPADRRAEALAPETLHLLLAQALINQSFERYFLPIFWYALLGPVGLVLALGALSLSLHYPARSIRRLFARIVTLLAWLPSRMLSFSFAIAGDFTGWLHEQRRERHLPGESRQAWLLRGASGALSSYALDPRRFEQLHPGEWPDYGRRSLWAVRDLLNRSMLVWIAVMAVLAILGWLP